MDPSAALNFRQTRLVVEVPHVSVTLRRQGEDVHRSGVKRRSSKASDISSCRPRPIPCTSRRLKLGITGAIDVDELWDRKLYLNIENPPYSFIR